MRLREALVWVLSIVTMHVKTHLSHSMTCEITLTVDKLASKGYGDWRHKYNEYKLASGDNSTLKLAFTELQDALLALNDTINSHKMNGCIEVTVSQGLYSVNISVYLFRKNLKIVGNLSQVVTVDFNFLDVPDVITIFGSDYVEIRGIHFTTSPGQVTIEKVTHLQISDCTFRLFSRGALDIYQCFLVNIVNCLFENNGHKSAVKPSYQYRGHAGGLSVGYDDDHYNVNGTDPITVPAATGIYVTNCTFRNNTNDPPRIFTSSQLLQEFVFPGRGGAVIITINASFTMNTTFSNCTIEDNYAVSVAGGMYILFSGHASHKIVVNTTVFSRNHCKGFSGGLLFAFLETSNTGQTRTLLVEIHNSRFDRNNASLGGGIYLFANDTQNLYPSSDQVSRFNQVATFNNCTFTRNWAEEFGAALCLNSFWYLTDTSYISPVSITNCVFEENFGGRAGVLSIAYLPVLFHGHNIFCNNTGRVLVMSGTRAEIHGSMHFLQNRGIGLDSGAVYFTSFAQFELYSGSDMLFENNSGILGASIIEESCSTISGNFAKAPFNPLCILRSENFTDKPEDWNNPGLLAYLLVIIVKITFSGNEARVGSAVYLSNIDFCSWTGIPGPLLFERKKVFHWNFINFTEDNVNTAHSPQETTLLRYVQTRPTSISLAMQNVTAYPGQRFSLKVVSLDELGQPATVSIRLIDISGQYVFNPSASSPVNTNILTKFSISGESNASITKTIEVGSIFTQEQLAAPVHINLLPCPVGYLLQPTNDRINQWLCYCNHKNNDNIKNCEAEVIILTTGQWGVETSVSENADRLMTYPCPQHYCQCLRSSNTTPTLMCEYLFDPKQPDIQCICGRKGFLCGDCTQENAGFSALLNNCATCGETNIFLILFLCVVDVLVIGGLLLFLRKSIYDWLYPSIFFIQIVPLISIGFPVTFEVVQSYLHYVASGLSFYFVYDFCLGPQFPALLVYFLRFIPVLITMILTMPVILFRHWRKKTNQLWPGLWVVFLLQCTHVLNTSISVLHCPRLAGYNETTKPRWYINGNIECFTGWHTPLALLSIAMLAFYIIIMPTALLITLFKKSKKRNWLFNGLVPSSEAFKKKYKWWGAVELIKRPLVLILVITVPGNNYWVIFCSAIVEGVYIFVQPYKSLKSNIMEAFLAFTFLVLLLTKSYNSDNSQQYIVLKNYTNEECIDSAVPIITGSTIVLAVGYYTLLIVLLLSIAMALLIILRTNCKEQKKKLRLRQLKDSEDTDGEYHLLRESSQTEITTTVVSTDDDQAILPDTGLVEDETMKASSYIFTKSLAERENSL